MKFAIGKYRRLTQILLAVFVWLVWCLPSLLANDPDAFQASGSVIVVMAIVIYARERAQRENEVTQAQRRQIVSMLTEHDDWGVYHESRSTRAAMETELQMLQIRRSLLREDSEDDSEVVSRMTHLQQALDESTDHHEQLRQTMQNSSTTWKEVHEQAEKVVQLQAPAAKALEKLELFLLVIGTLQWGYGDRWVAYLHSII